MTTYSIPVPPGAKKKRRRMMPRSWLHVIQYATPVALIVLWWAGSSASTDVFFPPLSFILERFQALWLFENFVSDVLPSLGNLVVSYLLAVIIGVTLGMVLGLAPVLGAIFAPVIHFWRAIPPVALVPLIVALFGFGNETRILAITLAALFPTLITTIDAMRSVDPLQREVARVYHLTFTERVFRVMLPAALPRIFSGMQVSLVAAFIVMIASEMLGVSTGIGALTLLAQQTFAVADMWAGVLLLGIIGFGANALFEFIERRALRWYYSAQRLGTS
ncbi:ABC transporter permease [Mycetocola sp.]|uniref:ABC transporter permease n=1 Tax=Mycetocola sp. TaxID=1871042 RepID=UPI003989B814